MEAAGESGALDTLTPFRCWGGRPGVPAREDAVACARVARGTPYRASATILFADFKGFTYWPNGWSRSHNLRGRPRDPVQRGQSRSGSATTAGDLTVNEEKTRICKVPEGEFDFLGYTFGRMFSATASMPAGPASGREFCVRAYFRAGHHCGSAVASKLPSPAE